MKLKNLACAALAGALALSLSAPAFAAEELSQSTEYEGSMSVPTINITVPDSGTVVLNPYKLSVTPQGGSATTDQIINATSHITNASNVALNVSATVTGKLPTGKKDVTFATATTNNPAKPLTTNAIFMYFEIGPAASDTAEASWPEGYVAKPAADQEVKQILVKSGATTVNNLLTLESGVNASGSAAPTYAAYRLTGDIVSAPTRAWAEDDNVSASVAFTFTPTATAED